MSFLRTQLLFVSALVLGCSNRTELALGSAVAGGASVDVDASVLQRNGDAARSGHFVVPSLTRDTVAKYFFDLGYTARFAGVVWASPLYLEDGPRGRGTVFVVTTNDDVHALDAQSGASLWSVRVGSSPKSQGVACAEGRPLGIVSTPVIDPASRTIFVAASVGETNVERHEIHALSVDDGRESRGFPVDLSQVQPGFHTASHYQAGALSLVGSTLYVAYGGADAECNKYRGRVFAFDTRSLMLRGVWTSDGLGAGVDAPGGMASDGAALFIATGRSAQPDPIHQDSQQLLRWSAGAAPGADGYDRFYPANWREMDESGANLGASNPILVDVPGATPARLLAAMSSNGHLFLLDREKLGGMGGQLADLTVAAGGANLIRTAPTTYRTSRGVYIAFTAARGVTCPAASPAPPPGNEGQVVVGVRVEPGAPPAPKIAWCYPLVAGQGAPVSTTTDGSSDATVWVMDDAKLVALDGDTGRAIFNGGDETSGVAFAERSCPGVAPWTSPIAVGSRMMVAARGRLCAWAKR